MADGSITRWIGRLKAGDLAAAQPLWEAYFRRVVGLARERLRGAPRRAADEEDVALSAFDSFFAGATAGRYPQLADRHNLWPLLVAITAHKCVDLVRRETRRKRGGGATPADVAFDELIGREPTPEFAAQLADELDRLLTRLDDTGDPTLRPVALAKMDGDSTDAIAARLGCVRRTVERKLQIIARVWADGEPP
jgi:DNA-directed RNA polymerase specialized sigma24 family protein